MDTLVIELMDRVQEMADNPNDITGVPTGFYDLDRMTSGLQAGDLVVLAARPSMGKTAFAVNIAEHVALNEGLPVAIFSMEMGASQLAVRVVGSIGRIDQVIRLALDEGVTLCTYADTLRVPAGGTVPAGYVAIAVRV